MQGAEVKGENYQKLRGGGFSKNPLHWVPLFGKGNLAYFTIAAARELVVAVGLPALRPTYRTASGSAAWYRS